MTKMKCFILLCFVFLIEKSSGIIYRLNASDHDRLPSVFRLDNYAACLREPEGLFCGVDVQLVSDTPSELMMVIKGYSEHDKSHYNHSILRYGICVTQACKKFLNTTEARVQVRATIEACLNETLWDSYKLRGKVSEKISCTTTRDSEVVLTTGDIVVGVLVFTILGLNFVGTLYEVFCTRMDIKDGQRNRLLMCFSVMGNWRRLVAPPAEGPEPRLRRLTSLNGIKAWSTLFVILGHAPLPFVIAMDNTYDFEEMYHNILYHILFNGMMIVQTFFIMTGFLLSFNLLIYVEKHQVSLKDLPKFIVLRFLRLTPTYAVLLAIIATWFRFAGSGPLWQRTVQNEVIDCQNQWYLHLLYMNNYVNNTECMAHTWYLAADMQLYVVGLIFCVMMKSKRAQKVGLWMLFSLGVVIPGVQTYLQNLNGVVVASPENAFNLFSKDGTFNEIYKRGHTNLSAFSVGLILGYIVYHYITNKYEETCARLQKKWYLVWFCLPMILVFFFFGAIFYTDGPEMPLIVRALYAGLVKSLYSINISVLILFFIFKAENLIRSVIEWRGFTVPARVSYCAYLVHVMVIRGYAGTRTTMLHITLYQTLVVFFGILILTFLSAFPLYLLVEAPFNKLIKLITAPAPRTHNANFDKNNVELAIEHKEMSEKLNEKL